MSKRYFQKTVIVKKYLIIYIVYIIVLILAILWDITFFLVMFIIGMLATIMYIYKGIFDKISFNDKGITTYRFFVCKFYSWDYVEIIKFKEEQKANIIITIKIKKSDINPYTEIVLYDNKTTLDDIKQYYSSNKT